MSVVFVPQQQVIAPSSGAQECPICMDPIEGLCNRVVTDCGHAFHCSCLMQNAAHNGFGCPYCRTKMAEDPKEKEDEEYSEYSDEHSSVLADGTIFDEDTLTSFRMFHQRINEEEVEEEPAEEWESIPSDEEEESEPDEDLEGQSMPDAAYVAQKLAERGITMEDLVKNILCRMSLHNLWSYDAEHERRSFEVYGQFRSIISQYTPVEPTDPTPADPESIVPTPIAELPSVALPAIAESKSAVVYRRIEFIVHV